MKHIAAVGVVFCLLGWLGMGCQAPSPPLTSTPPPTITPTSAPTRTPTPSPGSLTDAEAIALVKEEVAGSRSRSPYVEGHHSGGAAVGVHSLLKFLHR